MKFTPQKCDAFKTAPMRQQKALKTAPCLKGKHRQTARALRAPQADGTKGYSELGCGWGGTSVGAGGAKSVNSKGMDETVFSSICDLYRKMKCFFCNVIL
ncbi:hypothetical protein AB6848_06380 [Serratia proteamaculans]|jgi:hypothetical protein|uniref:hypothetical protein n=1 Tax=Serratia proteamaculans TaxID=28151 RepID=UPI0024B958D1|nr:hypothetical protein [Serratia proteamaculans]